MRTLQHKFVEFIPDTIEEGILYISIEYCTAIHKCICGCGNEVVTPFSPTDWELRFNGKAVSLSPSIGNWSFECRSHYWIKNNKVEFAKSWTEKEIRLGRDNDFERKKEFYKEFEPEQKDQFPKDQSEPSFWEKLLRLVKLESVKSKLL